MVSINFICIDSASVCFTPSVLRRMFKDVAVIGHIYCHYHQNPSYKYANPVDWFGRGTQTVWLSIREWDDTNKALKMISELKHGKSSISTPLNSDVIEFEATDVDDMTRFHIDAHSLPTKKTRYSLDLTFDKLKPTYSLEQKDVKFKVNTRSSRHYERKNSKPIRVNATPEKKAPFIEKNVVPGSPKKQKNTKRLEYTIVPKNLSLVHPELLDNDCPDSTLPSAEPYIIDMFDGSKEPYIIDMFSVEDEDDLDNYNCHKRQKTKNSEVLVYNVYKCMEDEQMDTEQ